MKKSCIFFVISLVMLLPMLAQSQAPDTVWLKTFGNMTQGAGSEVEETSDGELILIGSGITTDANSWDICLIKTDADGNMLWTNFYGNSGAEQGKSIGQMPDDGFILAGWKRPSVASNKSIILLKVNSSGSTLWTQTDSLTDREVRSMETSPDGELIMAGYIYNDAEQYENVLIEKADSLGNVLWRKNFGGEDSQKALAINSTLDGGYLIAGWSDAFPRGSEMYIVKTNQDGDTIWTRTYGDIYNDGANSILETPGHNFIIGGSMGFWYGDYAALLFLNEDGDSLGTVLFPYTKINCMIPTDDGNIVMAGSIVDSLTFSASSFIAKVDFSGQMIWSKVFSSDTSASFYISGLIQTSDYGYVFTGTTYDYPEKIILGKLSANQTNINGEDVAFPKLASLNQNYPNPFNPATIINYNLREAAHVTIDIYDLLGQKIKTLVDGPQQPGQHQITWNAGNAATGIYFYKLHAGDMVVTKKMLLLK